MTIELDTIQLDHVHRIQTAEQAAFVYHQIPGLAGNVAQEIGRDSVRLRIDGICYGPKAKASLEKFRAVYTRRVPVDFIADIVGQAYVGKVLLDRLEVREEAGDPEQFSYSLVVVEYVQPPRQTGGAAAVDRKIAVEAKALVEIAALPDALALGSLPEITNPFQPLSGALDPLREATADLDTILGGLRGLLGA